MKTSHKEKQVKEPIVLTEIITPQRAKELLAQNTHNRPVRPKYIDRLADAMKRGEWMLNCESIKIGLDGIILDGQHRLLAVIKSNCAIESSVAYNLDPLAFQTIDSGERRGAADILFLAGESYNRDLAAAAKIAMRFKENKRFLPQSEFKVPTNTQTLEFVRKHPQLSESVKFCLPGRRIYGAAGMGIHFILHSLDEDEADAFFLDFMQGTGLKRNQSVYWLRERFLNQRHMVLRPLTKIALIIKAWNRRDESVSSLQWRENEPFPIIGEKTKAAIYNKKKRQAKS